MTQPAPTVPAAAAAAAAATPAATREATPVTTPNSGEAPPPGFTTLPDLVAAEAATHPDAPAVVVGGRVLSWAAFNALVDRVAAACQRNGLQPQQVVSVCGASSAAYVALFVGALRAGLAVAPLAPSSTPEQLVGMASDADARLFFVDADVAAALDAAGATLPDGMQRLRLDDVRAVVRAVVRTVA